MVAVVAAKRICDFAESNASRQTRCQKPDREGGQLKGQQLMLVANLPRPALPYGRASDTLFAELLIS